MPISAKALREVRFFPFLRRNQFGEVDAYVCPDCEQAYHVLCLPSKPQAPPFNQRFFWWGDHILCDECRWDRLKEAPGSNINPLADCQDARALDFD